MESNEQELISLTHSVPAEFASVFSHFYTAANTTDEAVTRTLLPSFQTILIFSLGTAPTMQTMDSDLLTVDKCVVLGPVRRAFQYTLPPGSEILVVNFRDDAFYRFFGQVMATGSAPVNPDALMEENCFTALWQLMKNLDGTEARIQAILEFARPYMRERSLVPSLLIRQLESADDAVKVVAGQTGLTRRSIQLEHKKVFGYSNKELARYSRFLKAVELTSGLTGKADWFGIIDLCGYYDQSHLIADFRHFLGLSPTQFLRFQLQVCQPGSA